MTIDTLAAAKALERAGMENGQAEAIANVVRDATADLATKADLNSLLAGLEGRLNERLDAQEAKLGFALAAQEGRLRGELYKALWVFGLGVISVNIAVISAAVGVALWLWPPGEG